LDKRNKEVQALFDHAISVARELLETSNFSSQQIFEMACLIAEENFVPNKPVSSLPVGEVDTTRVAFELQDGDSVSMISGDREFAINIDKTVYVRDPEGGE
jgi:hypothetical protein